MRQWADDRVEANRPARVSGEYGRALAVFAADGIGDLVDIEYLCRDCVDAETWTDALDYPFFDFGDGGAYCRDCEEQIA
jgi:hypothetical protein